MRYVILAMALCIVGRGVTLAETLDGQVVRFLHEGKYAEAESLALQALAVSLKKNGPGHELEQPCRALRQPSEVRPS